MSDSLKQTVVDVKVGDVVRPFSRDKVVLVGSYLVEDSSYMKNLEIIINQENAESITTTVPYEGYGLGLVIEDFNGDGKDEIMLRGAYGGSENLAIAAIYDYRDGKLAEIFNPWMFKEHYKLDAKYLEGYQVMVMAPQRGEKYIYDISQSPKIYLNMIYNESGEIVSDLKPTVGDVNGVFPIQVVTAKNPYLFIRQGIVGVGNADRIGYIESFVNLKDNNIKLIDSGAYVKGEKIEFPELVAYYKALLENDKGSLIYQYYLALAYIKAGNYEKALQTANQARDKQNSI